MLPLILNLRPTNRLKPVCFYLVRQTFTLLMLTLLAVFLSTKVNAQEFNHPGAMHSQADLVFIKQKIDANKEPWKSSYTDMKNSKFAKLSYNHKAFNTVKCGSYNKPNVGCNEMVEDGMAAYTLALQWYITEDSRYAAKAIDIIDDWSLTYRKNTESNARLIVSWATPWYVNAAEILRYSDSGWSNTNTNRLNAMLNRFKNYIFWEDRPANNWMMSAVEARLAIAVFQDDRSAFNEAIDRWKYRVRTYIYQTSDGSEPIVPNGFTRARNLNVWKQGSTNLKFVDGLNMETCRDLNHTKLGFDSLMNGAEIAWQQGVDLFSLEQKRLSDFLNLHGNWMTGGNVPNNICDGELDFKGSVSGSRVAFEIAYNHLHDRLGETLKTTREMIDATRPDDANRWVRKWESLAYANRPFSNAENSAPTVSFITPSSNRTVQLGYELTVEVHADDVDGRINNVKLFVDNNLIRQENNAPYEWGHSGSPKPTELNGLPIGNHTIKAVATDNDGKSSDASFRLRVEGDSGLAPSVSFLAPTGNISVNSGYSLRVEAGTNDADGSIDNVKLYIDNQLVRQESHPPYEWGHAGSPNVNELNGLAAGNHQFRLVATDDDGLTKAAVITLTVNGSGNTGGCQQYSGSDRKEFNLETQNCIDFAGGLSGKTVQVWDSDSNPTCNFRGSVTASNGSTQLLVDSNYKSASGFTGNTLRLVASNGCRFVKLRAY